MKKYRIIREQINNENGRVSSLNFYIQILEPKLIFWKKWKYIIQPGNKDLKFPERTSFQSIIEAENYIKWVLIPNKNRRSEVFQIVINEYDKMSFK